MRGVVDALYTSGAGCLCCLFFLMGSEGLEFGVSSAATCAFFMDSYLGNPELLDRYLVAFFASRETPEDVAKRACQWAEMICQTDKVVISGFHSPVEKEVLRILLEHKHPVVLVLGRALYKRIPKEYVEPLDEGSMLIINSRNDVRHGWWNSQHRNFVVCNYADECVFAEIHRGSTLDVLFDIYLSKSKKLEDF